MALCRDRLTEDRITEYFHLSEGLMNSLTDDVLCVIPARGGSRRVSKKNIAPICGRPALAWTLDYLQDMRTPHTDVVVTDDPEIAAVANGLNVRVIEEQKQWADAEYELVAVHEAALMIESERGNAFSAVVLAYACCPVRPAGIFDRAIAELINYEADVVQSVVRVPAQLHPYRTFETMRGGDLREVVPSGRCLTRTQDLPPVFAISAAAVVIEREILRRLRFSGVQRCPRFRGIPHDLDEFVDIDEPHDLERAAELISRNRKNGRAKS